MKNKKIAAIISGISALLPDASVVYKEVVKENGTKFDGVVISAGNSTISPCIYFDMDKEVEEIIYSVISAYNKAATPNFDLPDFNNFESVKQFLTIHVVNASNNAEMLEGIPVANMLDLSAYVAISGDNFAVKVTEALVKSWNISFDDIFRIAFDNLASNYKMTSLGEMLGIPGVDLPFYVVTNNSGNKGAGVIAAPKILKSISERFGDDLIIFPSSIHEILLTSYANYTPDMAGITAAVNGEALEPGEVLSDKVYRFNINSGLSFLE